MIYTRCFFEQAKPDVLAVLQYHTDTGIILIYIAHVADGYSTCSRYRRFFDCINPPVDRVRFRIDYPHPEELRVAEITKGAQKLVGPQMSLFS